MQNASAFKALIASGTAALRLGSERLRGSNFVNGLKRWTAAK